MLEYQQPESRLTLESGRAEYYANNSGLVDGRSVSPVAREFFRCHDTANPTVSRQHTEIMYRAPSFSLRVGDTIERSHLSDCYYANGF